MNDDIQHGIKTQLNLPVQFIRKVQDFRFGVFLFGQPDGVIVGI